MDQFAEVKPIKILIVDDHPVIRQGVVSYLAQHPRFTVVAESADGLDAVAKARELSPDVVLMDIEMPGLDGLSATEALRQENPWIKVLIFSVHASWQYLQRILKSGASGFLPKTASLEQLAQAIESVVAGKGFFNLGFAQGVLYQLVSDSSRRQKQKPLTRREREVLAAIADGLSNKEIGNRLGINARTVKTHRQRMMLKLNVRNVAGLTRFAVMSGLVSLPSNALPMPDFQHCDSPP